MRIPRWVRAMVAVTAALQAVVAWQEHGPLSMIGEHLLLAMLCAELAATGRVEAA